MSACDDVGFGDVSPTIKIGVVAPFEGLHRPLGYEALFGVKLALQERNLAQGIHGYRIELVALNDFDDPAEAQIQARALVADPDVLGVVGHLSSVTTLTALPIYQEAELAVSIPWTVSARLDMSSGGVVSIAANSVETSIYLETIGREMGINNSIKLTGIDIGTISNDTQAIYLATDGATAGEMILALEQAKVSLPLFGQVDVGNSQVLQVAKAAANGLVFVSPGPNPQDVSGTGTFIEAYQVLAGFPPGPRAVLAYDATHVLLDAIEQAMLGNNYRQPTRAEISDAIIHVKRPGITGDINFDRQGWRINAPIWIYQISEEMYPGELIAP